MGGNFGFVVLVVAALAVVVQGQNYCSLCRDHTMCLYTGVGPKCNPKERGGVTNADKNKILDAINSYRDKVAQGQEERGSPGPQPAAANMRLMVWSDELAKIAQRWAEQCDFTTDKCRSTSQFRYVGQGVYRTSSTGPSEEANWQEIIDDWSRTVTSFNNSTVSRYQQTSGVYSQLVWADSYHLGCGYVEYKETPEDEWTHNYYVCNFGPGGNIMNKPVYRQGTACSKCPSGTSCRSQKYPGLCS